jgi:glutamine synthetase
MVLSGRTLFGHASAKDQQLEDNYFGTIPERAMAFMKELEIEAHMLGIPVKTRHNEVAPGQFECAPIFEEANIAVDHNQLLMDLTEKIARKHNFVALLHEKPYAGVNGSGKHNNWSLMTDSGENLLSPGKTSKSNFRFLVFLINIIKAVYDYNDLLRASIASAGNEHRLGANEAPPAIFSVFIGKHLTKILNEIEQTKNAKNITNGNNNELHLKISKIPEILIDNTDRNRTSPFAFTGNKFEFRAVGSSANCSSAMISLNAIVAAQFKKFKQEVDKLTGLGIKKNDAIFKIIKQYVVDSKPIRFEGNNYSDDWIKQAGKRGLKNISSTPEALQSFLEKKNVDLLENLEILTKRELHARYEVLQQNYVKKIQIEARVLGDIAINHIIPVAIKYQNVLIKNIKGIMDIFGDKAELTGKTKNTLEQLSGHITAIQDKVDKMIEARKNANKVEGTTEKAMLYNKEVLPYLEDIRTHIDKLELLVDDELWPMPKYRELLFIK